MKLMIHYSGQTSVQCMFEGCELSNHDFTFELRKNSWEKSEILKST